MKINEGNQDLEIELADMHTDKTLTYWDAKKKEYVKVTHNCLPKSHFLLAIAGRCGSGKSTVLTSLLTSRGEKTRVYRGCFDFVYFICNRTSLSSMKNSPFGEIPEDQCFEDFTKETLTEVWNRVQENKENDKDSLIVIDDQVSRTRQFESQFHNICLVFRHFRCSIIWCVQDIKMISPVLRNNLSGLILFRNENKEREKIVHQEYLSYLNPREWALFAKYVWRNHGDTLYIDMKSHPMKLYRNYKLLDISGYESEVTDDMLTPQGLS